LSTPNPATTEWIPLWQIAPTSDGIPLPVQDGQWVKGAGGVATWAPISGADVPGLVAADNDWRYIGAPGQPVFQSGWRNYEVANGWVTGRFRKTVTNLVVVQGFIQRAGTPTQGEPIFYLPAGYIPAYNLTFANVSYNWENNRMDIYPNGAVAWVGGTAANAAYTWYSMFLIFPAEI
jgi:hypothetical protein